MDEYIKRETLLQEVAMQKAASKASYPRRSFVVGDVISCIRAAPAADVAPVVRCRECRHWKDWGACGHPDNGWDAPKMGTEDFCSKGEKAN